MEWMTDIPSDILKGDYKHIEPLVNQALIQGVPAREILNKGLLAGMDVVGKKFAGGEFFLPEVLLSARAMKAGMGVLRPHLKGEPGDGAGKVVMGTMAGDLHDIGKNLVKVMLEGAGFEVIDLGIDVRPERFVQAVQGDEARVVGMSALLTTTMLGMKDVISALVDAGLAGRVKTIIGGAPVTQGYADEIGADGYAPDAVSAVEVVKELLV